MSKVNGKTATPRLQSAPEPIDKADRPVTLADIAKCVGVHVTTVSLALREHPSIPAGTRETIRAAARDLGYQRDPMLDAFNFHRTRMSQRSRTLNSAFVVHAGASRFFGGSHYQPLVYAGAKAVAEARGHSLDIFVVGREHLSPARLNSILSARGITGVLLSTFEIDIAELDLDWSQLCAVKIECLHLTPNLDAVSNDQLQAARSAMRKLRKLGYRRIGLATAREDQARLEESFGMGVLLEQASLPEAECVPPLIFGLCDVPRLPSLLKDWVARHGIEVIISNWNELLDIFATSGVRLPEDIAFASLDVPPSHPHLAGIVQNHRLVGQKAMEQLAIMTDAFQRGVPSAQTITYIPGRWRDGATVPPRTRPNGGETL